MRRLKKPLSLIMVVLLIILSFPLSSYASQPDNSFVERYGNFYLAFDGCTLNGALLVDSPEAYSQTYYNTSECYDVTISEVSSDGLITVSFSWAFDAPEGTEFPYISSEGYTKEDITVYKKNEALWNEKLQKILDNRKTSYQIDLNNTSGPVLFYVYSKTTYSNGYKKLKSPGVIVLNFLITASDYSLTDVSPKLDQFQFENKSALFGLQHTAFLVVPSGTDSIETDLTFSTSGIEVFVNDIDCTNPLVPDADNKLTVDLNVGTNHENSINTISIRQSGGTETENSYTLYCLEQLYSGLPDRVIDYLCIGSQYTNVEDNLVSHIYDYGLRGVRSLVGSTFVASSALSLSGPTSLGNFGGYIIYYYEDAIKDDPNNPYGIDFITYGNSYSASSEFAEPGQVWVSPDGVSWYALAGSLHYENSTNWEKTLVYSKSDNGRTIVTSSDGTQWTQDFKFPEAYYYPWHDFGDDPEAPITLTGISLGVEEGTVYPLFPAFGYTDVGTPSTVLPEGYDTSRLTAEELGEGSALNVAGNPYLGSVKKGNLYYNSTTDGMDLAWAVDSDGQPVTFPDGIHYVKIVCANNIDAGAIGEKSTEVNMVRVARADSSAVGVTAAPTSISFDGNVVDLTAVEPVEGTDNVFAFAGDNKIEVRGAFEVEVEAGNANVFINNEKSDDVIFDAAPTHGIVRVIVQEDEKEPLIYVFSLDPKDATQDEIDREAARAVDKLIDAISDPVTLESKDAVEKAEEAYNNLTEEQKALVTKKDKLDDARAALDELLAQDFGTVHVIVENTTYSEADGAPWEGTLVDTTVELTADSSMIGVVAQAVEAAGYTQTGAANGYISEINGLAEKDGGTDAGWMGMLNDWVTNQGFDAFTVANGKLEGGDEIYIYYTVTGLGADNMDTSLIDLKASVGEFDKAFDPQTLTYTLTVPAGTEEVKLTPTAACKNFYVSIKSGGTEYKRTKNIPVADGTVITLEVGAPTMNTGFTPTTYKVVIAVETSDAVKRVEDLIDAIGEVTADSGDAIFAARTAYDALTDEEKAQVSNYADLQAAEEAFAALSAAAVKAVEDLIDAIPDTVTEDDKEAIEAARAAYDALTDEQKKQVENYEDLLVAEAALDKLEQAKVEDIYKATGDYLEKLIKDSKDGLTVNAIGGEWAALGLARAGRDVPRQDEYLAKVDAFVKANANDKEQLDKNKSTENSRVILALTALGKDVSDVAGHDLLAGLSDLSYLKKQGNNGPIWALIALDSHEYEPAEGADATRDALVDYILSRQLDDGGWVLDSGTAADTDMTAMALQALAPYYKTNDKVKAAVDKALACLSAKQSAVGGFGSVQGGDATVESSAQVVVALTALGIDPASDERFVKNGISVLDNLCSYYVEGGGFEHVAGGGLDGMATEQAFYALASYFRFKDNKTSLYDMTDVEIKKSEEPAEPTEDEKAAAAVDEKIAAIGDVTLDSEEAIEAAREAYDALTEDQKALVKNLADLEAAEKKLAELKKAAADGTITKAVDKNGKDIAYTLDDVDEKHILTKEKAAEVNDKIDNPDQVEILWQKDIVVPDGTDFPATLTFAVPKKYQDKDVFVYHYNGTDWEVVAEGKGSEVSAKFDSLSPGALVAKSNESGSDTTPATGDTSNMYLWGGICVAAVVCAAAVVISSRKRRED